MVAQTVHEFFCRWCMGCHPPSWEEWNKVSGGNPRCYKRLPHDSMLPWTTVVFGLSFVYVQDNATTHTSCDTITFLAPQDVEVKGWPAQSPDMNHIKHVWDQTGVWLRNMDAPRLFRCVMRGVQFAQEEWGPLWRACHVVCVLFSLPEGSTRY